MDPQEFKMMLANAMQRGLVSGQRLLACNMDPRALRTNATLRKDEWLQLDTAIIEEARIRLVGWQDLESKGLKLSLSNGLGTTILESENVSDVNDAEMDMDAVTKANNETLNYELVGVPLPIIHKEYQISIRRLNASRTRGESLDTTQARLATRKVNEYQEQILFLGTSSFAYGGYTIRGYLDHPNRNTVTLSENWDASGKTGAEIRDDVLSCKQALINARHYGPYYLYIPTAYETVLDKDYDATRGNTIEQRIMAIRSVEKIQIADKLTANNVLMVQMTEDVVRIVEGLPITNVEWDTRGGLMSHMKIMTIGVPQIRDDQSNRSGIAHLS
jgi:uncharacterized linocin/CFP29 family protein